MAVKENNDFNIHGFLNKQLDVIYDAIKIQYAHRQTTKNWCLTLWLAILTFTLSTKTIPIEGNKKLLLTIVPIVLFWLIEGGQGCYTRLLDRRARLIESIFINGKIPDQKIIQSYLFLSGDQIIPIREKIASFFYSLFCTESIFFFYLLLLILSLIISNFI